MLTPGASDHLLGAHHSPGGIATRLFEASLAATLFLSQEASPLSSLNCNHLNYLF